MSNDNDVESTESWARNLRKFYAGDFGTTDNFVTVSFGKFGNMVIKYTGEEPLSGDTVLESWLHDIWLCNSEISIIDPADVGAITDGIILGIASYDDDGDFASANEIWGHKGYETEDPLQAMQSPDGWVLPYCGGRK